MVAWWGARPSGGGPGAANEATDGDDRVGQVEERLDDACTPFVAARQPGEGVVPGVGPLDVSALRRLHGGFDALASDLAGQVTAFQQVAGLVGVIARVQVNSDVVGQRSEVVQQVQGGRQER